MLRTLSPGWPWPLVALMILPTSAWSGNESRYRAYATGGDTFEVIADFTENAIYWCGASIFARKDLRAPVNQRIFVLSGPGPSRTEPGQVAVRFGLTAPASGAVSSLTNSVSIIGNSLSVSQARGGCTERSSSG